jgi:transmembrane sensor
MNEPDERIRDAIIEQAAHWYLRNREGGLSATEKGEFLQWLRASLQRTNEYLAIARLSGSLRAALADLNLDPARLLEQAQEEGSAMPVLLDPIGPRRRNRPESRNYKRTALVGLVAAAFIGACALYWLTAPGFAWLPRVISVPHGEQRTVQLNDGSVMHVNASSHLRVRFSRALRLIELDQGQAMFEVAHDSTRPFRVRAGGTEVTAVGTKFDVYRRGSQQVTVTVIQGKVDVMERDAQLPSPGPGSPDTVLPIVHVVAGEQLQLGAARRLAAKRVDVRAATAWVRREVMFEGRSLRDVTDEFNRYIPKPIEIEDPALNDLEVNGVFNAYDSDSFLVFLRQYDVQVTEDSDAIHVGRRASH